MSASRGDLAAFLDGNDDVRRALLVVAAPESATDDLIRHLLVLGGWSSEWAAALIGAIHRCDFVVERNSEWHLAPSARSELMKTLVGDHDLSLLVHSRLLELATPGGSDGFDGEFPRYLREGPGRAYHGVFVNAPGALQEYGAIAEGPRSGQQWLASRLATEQVDLALIPADAVEVLFLQGMVAYREGRVRDAEPKLRKVANTDVTRHEVAVAAHLIGGMDARRYRSRPRGEKLLRKSLELLDELGDPFGEAQVLHTLGQLVGRDSGRSEEAETQLRKSREIGEVLGNRNHQAQVLYSMARVVGVLPSTAEELLRESLRLNRAISNKSGERIVRAELRRRGLRN